MILNNIFYASGVLFYTKTSDNSIYFLLGKSNDNKWSDFGGRAEIIDKCDTYTTACREAWEETLGCVYDYEMLRSRVKFYDNCITSKTQGGKPYYMYMVYLPYTNIYRDKFLSTKKFVSRINVDTKFLEISDIKWVSLDTIKASVNNNNPMIKLRYVFGINFHSNIVEIINIINS
jgi:hypothetical protein